MESSLVVGKWYRLRFTLGETWIGLCVGEKEDDGKRLVLFDVGQRDGDLEEMIAGIETHGIVECTEVVSVRPFREADLLLWREA